MPGTETTLALRLALTNATLPNVEGLLELLLLFAFLVSLLVVLDAEEHIEHVILLERFL